MSRACLIGLDWGTSTLRAYSYAIDGAVLERRERPMGIAAVSDGRFREAFESVCADWLRDTPEAAVIACGMIGSRQGWSEAPYLPTPAGFREIAAGLVRIDALAGRRFAIVPGVQTTNEAGTRDVMRGEETQLFGVRAEAPRDGRFVLPGTHSKWVSVHEGRIAAFRTYLTGELFAVLARHSILGRLFAAPVGDMPVGDTRVGDTRVGDTRVGDTTTLLRADRAAGFELGVRRAASDPAGLGALLFSVRSEGLFATLAPDVLPEHLSGLLIGAEIAHALGPGLAEPVNNSAAAISIIGADRLAERYRRALEQLGARAAVVAGEPAARGLASIAREGGLID